MSILLETIVIIFLLVRWSKQLENRRFTLFFYFLISTYITPIYSYRREEEGFELWILLGFLVVILQWKASVLGFLIAIYQLILQYFGSILFY
ncbi:hypothetical protein [Oceanobacillus kapialis]|uniref:hypothetical protein n=1 Tax=Oceanobacillus kapialis TaxID=481353 RepID=UPI00384CD290